ncbi:hypothetical protein ADL05_24765 [Nocardiopsis sp. NRRL B-16309]|nr:hypothetical protein ADL05_24765 [Nocardiopsis sp. NRRL B-16309]
MGAPRRRHPGPVATPPGRGVPSAPQRARSARGTSRRGERSTGSLVRTPVCPASGNRLRSSETMGHQGGQRTARSP